MSHSPLESIPSVEKLTAALDDRWTGRLDRAVRIEVVRRYLTEWREELKQGGRLPASESLHKEVEARFEALTRRQFRRCLNATGVVLHTNLGRAPIGRAALQRATETLSGYSTLEMDWQSPERGSRTASVEPLICHLLRAEAAAVVNNNAAAVFLALFALARGKRAVVSRGELVQIGGGFRVPEILEASGATLTEVGSTNITTVADYERALLAHPDSVLLKVHRSNFTLVGHTQEVGVVELAALAQKHGVTLLVDWGSGSMAKEVGDEPSMRRLLQQGATVLCFSGDKLMGGPQAGVLAGRKACLDIIKKAPLYRAMRLSKFELFLLEETLLQQLAGKATLTEQLLALSAETLNDRATAFLASMEREGLRGELCPGHSETGGGTTPHLALPTTLVEWRPRAEAEKAAKDLFALDPAVVLRREKGKLFLDLRTILPEEEPELLLALIAAERVSCS